MARLTVREAAEEIAREMNESRALEDIVQEVAARCGRPYTHSMKQTVSQALGHLGFVVRCGTGIYAPTRVALDGKAFRVPLSGSEVQRRELRRKKLEPFFTALGKPPIRTEDGQELATLFLADERLDELNAEKLRAIAMAFQELPWIERYLHRKDMRKVSDETWKQMDVSRIDSGLMDMTPLDLQASDAEESSLELIVRWDKESGVLKVSVSAGISEDTSETVASEDRILADFLFSRLPRQNAVSLSDLLLEAYARFPELGRTPGSHPFEVIGRDSRMRVIGGSEDCLSDVSIARADMLPRQELRQSDEKDPLADWLHRWREDLVVRIKAHPERLRAAWASERWRLGLADNKRASTFDANVVPLRKPSNEDLIAEWDQALREQGLSDNVRQRKVRHVETFVHYLGIEGYRTSGHLLLVDESDLQSFFFWTYVRRFPNSPSDALSFTLDLRDFYRYQKQRGRIQDARFAELFYGVRDMIVERLELYDGLLVFVDSADYEELYETLFLGYVPS
ncbi:MAG: hypothetical protein GX162_11805 [Firmicutes bacterium]|jgi:hypothetical protein|nr:hypothetical protein [Bacillota bacterium]